MAFYDWGPELSKFLSMYLTFNSIEAFTCLKCLNTFMNCDPNKVNKQWKRGNKKYLCSKYSEAYFKKLPHPLAMQLQPSQAASVLRFAHSRGEAEALESVSSSSLSSLLWGCAYLSFAVQSHPSRDTYMLTSPVHLWNCWENTRWRIKDEVLASLQCFS